MNRLIIVLLLVYATHAEKKTIECDYERNHREYACNLASNSMITEPFAENAKFTGTHIGGGTNSDVKEFFVNTYYGESSILNYFPRGLNEAFGNLKEICIHHSGLKEIHREDIESFSELEYLSLSGNEIEVLEPDLFHGNPKLKYLNLDGNKIEFIHPTAMDHLNHLGKLDLRNNECINERVYEDPTKIRELMKRASKACNDVVLYNSYMERKQEKGTVIPEELTIESGSEKLKISCAFFCIYCTTTFLYFSLNVFQ